MLTGPVRLAFTGIVNCFQVQFLEARQKKNYLGFTLVDDGIANHLPRIPHDILIKIHRYIRKIKQSFLMTLDCGLVWEAYLRLIVKLIRYIWK
jgi:hypothetical protein